MATVTQMQAENFGMALRDGPRLRYNYNVWVEAKDTESDQVLLGGLGSFGVGTMWFPMSERHKKLPGFDTAPEINAPLPTIYCNEARVGMTAGKRVCQMK